MSAMFKHGTKKLAVDLKEDVKNLMFTPSGPLCVSEDMGHFQGVMGLFYQYEQMVCADISVKYVLWFAPSHWKVHVEKHATDGAIFRKLLKHMDETFTKDFPFYLILAYRVHKYVCHQHPYFSHPFKCSLHYHYHMQETAPVPVWRAASFHSDLHWEIWETTSW